MPGKMAKKPTRSQRAQRIQVPLPISTSCSCAQIGDPNQSIAMLTAFRLPSKNRPSLLSADRTDPIRPATPARNGHRPWAGHRPGTEPTASWTSAPSHPAQDPFGPGGDQPDQENQEEDRHLDQREGPQAGIADRPGEQEYGLDVEDHKHQGV